MTKEIKKIIDAIDSYLKTSRESIERINILIKKLEEQNKKSQEFLALLMNQTDHDCHRMIDDSCPVCDIKVV